MSVLSNYKDFKQNQTKNASRVADMVAINELLDFRHFGSTNEVKSDNNDTIADKPNFNQNVSPMLRKLLNKTT